MDWLPSLPLDQMCHQGNIVVAEGSSFHLYYYSTTKLSVVARRCDKDNEYCPGPPSQFRVDVGIDMDCEGKCIYVCFHSRRVSHSDE